MPDLPDLPKTEIAIIAETNAFRRSEKLGDVTSNAELTKAARAFAAYLATTGKFAHEADGRQPADRVKAAGYKYCSVAENLALFLDSRGFTTERLATLTVEGWKNSPGHRRNLVSPHATEIGVGIARAPDKNPKFLAVQLFGRPERLKYQFKIENRAGLSIAYSLHGGSHTIEPRVVVTHTDCNPAEIRFERAGNWLTGIKLESRFEAKDGAVYSVVKDSDGRIRVDVTRR